MEVLRNEKLNKVLGDTKNAGKCCITPLKNMQIWLNICHINVKIMDTARFI